MRKTILTLAISGMATGVTAQWAPEVERRITADYHACFDEADAARGVDPAMLKCTTDEVYRQDLALNAAYKAAMKRAPTARRATLRASERDWIAMRDAKCEAAGVAAGNGTASRHEVSGCMLHETIKRTIWLERHS